jgi:hypothetical protein
VVEDHAPTLAAGEGHSAGGQLPFRIRLGVVGHRTLDEHETRLLAAVKEQVSLVRGLLDQSEGSSTPVKLAVVSALADGADRLVVREVFAQCGTDARLEVVLPLPEKDYIAVQEFDDTSRDEFERLVHSASLRKVLPGPWSKEGPAAGYEAAGRWVVRRSDVLIALWDGKRFRGRGGTAPTLLYAAQLGKPCIWIPTEGAEACESNLKPENAERFLETVRERVEGSPRRDTWKPRRSGFDTLKPLRKEFEKFDDLNRATIPPGVLQPAPTWCSAPFARAGTLAKRFQRRFILATWAIAALATSAAAALGIGLAWYPRSLGPPLAEIACVASLVAVFAYLRLAHIHERWLSCRFLAERLRTARYVAQTGADARRSAELETIFVDRSADWSVRAFEEVWDSRPRAGFQALSDEEVSRLSHVLADEWIDDQIDYHERKSREHERAHRALTGLIGVLVVGTLVFPSLHAAEVATDAAVFFSVVLPVAGLSLGAILTIRQHHALALRFRQMATDLLGFRDMLLDADTTSEIRQAAFEAARIVTGEAGDWLGAMWFLDADTPG